MINSQVHLSKFIELESNKLIERPGYFSVDTNLTKSIIMKGIKFKYFNSDEYIFDNLDLEIERNKHTIITGPNGSGKSTLLGLISKVFYPEKGEIKLNTDDIGYVGVTPLIIDGSLKDNLLYGNSSPKTDDEIMSLIKEFELFNNDERGLNTLIDRKSLSSGQMQKISFIRSLLGETKLLLLDESTSNLDIETKQLIFNILKNKDITIVNSTHNKEDFEYDYHIKINYVGDKRKIINFDEF